MASEIRKLLLRTLPIDAATVSVRRWQRVDMDTLAGWPEYEFPHRGFEFSFRALSSGQRDAAFQEREADRSRITLVAESADRQLIAYVALLSIDWTRAEVRALSCRVHPQFCGQGTGTGVLRSVVEWAFEGGVCSIALDVAASNGRAIRCYEKVGFSDTGEIWRPFTLPVSPNQDQAACRDVTAPEPAFLQPHIRLCQGKKELRFRVMEIRRP